jgi:hypothetical protein
MSLNKLLQIKRWRLIENKKISLPTDLKRKTSRLISLLTPLTSRETLPLTRLRRQTPSPSLPTGQLLFKPTEPISRILHYHSRTCNTTNCTLHSSLQYSSLECTILTGDDLSAIKPTELCEILPAVHLLVL